MLFCLPFQYKNLMACNDLAGGKPSGAGHQTGTIGHPGSCPTRRPADQPGRGIGDLSHSRVPEPYP